MTEHRERTTAPAPNPPTRDGTTVAITGNVFFAGRLSRYRIPRFTGIVDRLRAADTTIANLECTIPAPSTSPAFVAGSGWSATYMAADPVIVDELKWLGIDLVCAANNHTADFGERGLLDTIGCLREQGLPFAGMGASLTEASAPTYVDAASGARIALISASDWGPRGAMGLGMPWPVGQLASDELPPFTSRPGLNLLRYEAVSTVRTDDLETLRRLSSELGWDVDKVARSSGSGRSHPLVGADTNLGVELDSPTDVWFLGRRFTLGDEPGTRTHPCEADVARIESRVRQARQQADVVCVALHDQSHGDAVHDYITAFAHRMIDAGADVYVNNGGTHKGIEIYRGKPVIYGVPTFFLQTEVVADVPREVEGRFGLSSGTAADFVEARRRGARMAKDKGAGLGNAFSPRGGSAWFELEFGPDLELAALRMIPFEHGDTQTLFPGAADHGATHRRFLPLLPGPDRVGGVLESFAERSIAFGTKIEVRDGIGLVDLGAGCHRDVPRASNHDGEETG